MKLLLTDYLKKATEIGAIQLFFTVGCPVSYRDGDGNIQPFEGNTSALIPENTKSLVNEAVKESKDLDTLRENYELETFLSAHGKMRCRINAYIQRGTYAMTVTILTSDSEKFIMPVEEWKLELTPVLMKPNGGLCIITGHHDANRLAASLVDYYNTNYKCLIITLEDSVTTRHKHKLSMVNQLMLSKEPRSTILRAKNIGADVCMISSSRNESLLPEMLELAMSGTFVIGVFGRSSLESLNKSFEANTEPHDLDEQYEKLKKNLKLCVDLDNGKVATEWLE